VTEQSSRHGRKPVLPGVETAHVIGEEQLGVIRHISMLAALTEMTLISVI
jgi:hypothetical protein